jgi:hypothetical protein
MTYEPTNWKTGDIVTAEKLNKIENYLANLQPGGGLLVTVTITEDDTNYYYTTDKTAGEVLAAVSAGMSVIVVDKGCYYPFQEFGRTLSSGYYMDYNNDISLESEGLESVLSAVVEKSGPSA